MNWFWHRCREQDGCLVWTGALNAAGYGVVWMDGKLRRAHVVAWEQEHGAVPAGKELDHTCRNRACVRHVEPVTHKENMERGLRATATHCVNGHAFSPENTYVWRTAGRTTRICRACRTARQRIYDERT